MKTAAEREAEFRVDLQKLLDLHGAELTVTDDDRGWGMHTGVCRIDMYTTYDPSDDSVLAEYCEFEL